jgi:hypothetical protein
MSTSASSTSPDLDFTEEIATVGRLSDDRLEILRMVENHIVSAEEANRLLEALDRTERVPAPPAFPSPPDFSPFAHFQGFPPPEPLRHGPPTPRLIRFRVSNEDEGQTQLNLVLPLGMVDSGLKILKRFHGDISLDAKELRQSVTEGYVGPLLDITDGGQRIEILID